MPRALRPHRWLLALIVGALLGAFVLGLGARLAMRAVALLSGRPPASSVSGTLHVVGFGALFGLVAACIRIALARLLTNRVPESRRTLLFALVCLVLAVIGLTPLTVPRLAFFLPVVALYVLAMELAWRRFANRVWQIRP